MAIDIKKKFRELEVRFIAREERYKERLREKGNLEKEIEFLIKEVEILEKTSLALQSVSTKIVGNSVLMVDKLVTAGLKVVFDDFRFEFKTEVDRARGRTSARLNLYEDGNTFSLVDSFGGGVLCIVGLLMRVTVILALDMKRVLLLDETLAHLPEKYHENASKLLKKLSKELNFTIIMVSHQPAFAQHADKHYTAEIKGGTTRFEEA